MDTRFSVTQMKAKEINQKQDGAKDRALWETTGDNMRLRTKNVD